MNLVDFLQLPLNYPGSTMSGELSILEKHISHLRNLELSLNYSDDKELKEDMESIDLREDQQYLRNDYERHLLSNHYHKINSITPRLTYSPIVVTLCGILESSINNFCMFAAQKENPTYKFKETNGKNIISRSNKYLNKYLGFEIDFSHSNEVLEIQKLRNYLAHTNGNINHLPTEKLKEIANVIEKLNNVEIVNNNIVVSYDAILEIFDNVSKFLDNFQHGFAQKYDYKAYKKT